MSGHAFIASSQTPRAPEAGLFPVSPTVSLKSVSPDHLISSVIDEASQHQDHWVD